MVLSVVEVGLKGFDGSPSCLPELGTWSWRSKLSSVLAVPLMSVSHLGLVLGVFGSNISGFTDYACWPYVFGFFLPPYSGIKDHR